MIKKTICALLFLFASGVLFSQNGNNAKPGKQPVAMTVEEFKARTGIKNKMVLVNFSADWCVVCKKQKPILDEIKIEKKDQLEVLEIDMEDNPLIAEYFEVDGLPVTLLYKNGVMVWDRMGFLAKVELLEVLRLHESKQK